MKQFRISTYKGVSSLFDENGIKVAQVDPQTARLIAAAPEMYRLLHAIWSKTDPSKDPKTCRAIANLLDRIDQTTKARGES